MVFIATATIINFINEMIATSAKPTIREFAAEVHKRFYPEQDIAFMTTSLNLPRKRMKESLLSRIRS